MDEFGFVTQITNPNGKTKYFDREIAAPSSFTELGVSDADYFGICYQETEINEKGIKSAKYYDGIGQLRCMIVDLGNAPHKNIKTTYNYDDFGRLIEVINPKNQSTTYTYDDDGRIKTKSQPDLGTIKYLYDKKGNIRFSQNDEQVANNKISYFQYDDLGRTSYIGEAKISVSDFFLLDPDKLAVPNASNVILTSNPTVWFKTTGNKVNKFANITINSDYFNYNAIRTEHNINFDSDVQEYTNGIVGPFIMHPTDYYPEISLPQDAANNFEDISQFPEFVKSAVYYDEIPPKMGYIWENMPPVEVVNKLAPKGEMQNLKGKRSVLAYRDNQDDPFHYVFFSYDARGRVESIIRWTENIGFEIVKYGYNSMNKVQFVNVIDAARQYCTWNVYDDNGRLWQVYSKMGEAGSGYDYQNQNYEDIDLPVPMTLLFELYLILKGFNLYRRIIPFYFNAILTESNREILGTFFYKDVISSRLKQ